MTSPPSHWPAVRTSGRSGFWPVMTLLSIGVAGASLHYLAGAAMVPPPLKANFLDHPLAFYVHIACGTTALLVGPWQFLASLRARAKGLHRLMGAVYIAACGLGGLAGMVIAPGSNGGPVAAAGFFSLAVLWIWTTGNALAAILRRDVAAHQRWMRRSFALTLAGVTLRLYLPAAFIDYARFAEVYAVIDWACWVPNLIVAEAINRRSA